MMKTLILFSGIAFALLVTAGLSSCQKSPQEPAVQPVLDIQTPEWTNGIVLFVDLEGGFYGIEGEDGTKYDPSYLAEEFQQDSLRVRFQYAPVNDAAGIRQWGRIVEIIAIERVE